MNKPIKCTGTEASYMRGCRCDECRDARNVNERKRRQKKRREAEQKSSEPEQKKEESVFDRRWGNSPSTMNDTFTLSEIKKYRGL